MDKQNKPKFSKRNSKAITLWVKCCQRLGYNQVVIDPITKKKKINKFVKKGTPEYDKVRALFDSEKAKGY